VKNCDSNIWIFSLCKYSAFIYLSEYTSRTDAYLTQPHRVSIRTMSEHL